MYRVYDVYSVSEKDEFLDFLEIFTDDEQAVRRVACALSSVSRRRYHVESHECMRCDVSAVGRGDWNAVFWDNNAGREL